ncbi:efflux RND transporter periplasmic adaptor subunit [Actinomyces sp. B33]|uniref:efflux RND transporter periplasmic adaptor subunit n=1 Tax=Actinomyces sp. B33 TaxID=2942131 RepID=UPI0023401A64|nr:efflux RND transporter periplasmic adaptor subunit [Actinomyces sp. B33]MDC4233455.1 efflux RND transporter periplasmic adaptor subunit [Actinomyces sp. B33]
MAIRVRAAGVLNAIKILLLAVIAIAFVKFAFFPASSDDSAAQSLDPSASYTQLTVMPARGDITNTLSLQGTIEADEASTAKATLDGEISYIYVGDGAVVASGDPLVEIRKEMPGEDREVTDPDGNVSIVPGKPWYSYATVHAPASGTLRLSALVGQRFAIGDAVATVQPPTYSAVATLTSDQMYRMQTPPQTATITVKNGPAPFECTNVEILTPTTPSSTPEPAQPGRAPSSSSSSSATASSIRARCSIPADQTVFVGLQVTVDLVAGEATGALLVPASAVEGRYQHGYVYAVGDDPAKPVKTAVELGLTDGKQVEVLSGIDESTEILEYTPNAEAERDAQGTGDAIAFGDESASAE